MTALDRKVEELEGILGFSIQYVPHDLKRRDDWIYGHFGLMRKDGKFFKIPFIRAIKTIGDKVSEWTQPMLVQEHNQYDRFACFRIVGDIALPVRCRDVDGVSTLEFGITALKGPGSYGEVTFTGPRGSLSNPEELTLKQHEAKLKQEKAHEEFEPGHPQGWIYRRLVRPDVNRLTGRVRIWVLKGDEQTWKNCVWFTAEELEELLKHEKMTDAPTRELIHYVLRKQRELPPSYFLPEPNTMAAA